MMLVVVAAAEREHGRLIPSLAIQSPITHLAWRFGGAAQKHCPTTAKVKVHGAYGAWYMVNGVVYGQEGGGEGNNCQCNFTDKNSTNTSDSEFILRELPRCPKGPRKNEVTPAASSQYEIHHYCWKMLSRTLTTTSHSFRRRKLSHLPLKTFGLGTNA